MDYVLLQKLTVRVHEPVYWSNNCGHIKSSLVSEVYKEFVV